MTPAPITGAFYKCKCVFSNKRVDIHLNRSAVYKKNNQSSSNNSNISNKQRTANRLILAGSSQNVVRISRLNSGITQFGNFYLKQPLSLNYLGRMEGQPGGGGTGPGGSLREERRTAESVFRSRPSPGHGGEAP